MSGCARLCLFAVLGLLAASLPVPAGTAADAAAQWGLLGSWKIDCGAPASVANGELRFVLRNGALFHDRDFGQDKDSNRVISASVRPDGAIDVVVKFAAYRQTREFVFSKGDDHRARTTSNRDVKTNRFTVAEGKFTRDGRDTPWQTHCP